MGMKAAITKSQIAKTQPNFFIPPSAFDAATQTVAGMRLKKKHMGDLPWNALRGRKGFNAARPRGSQLSSR
jgi:hypothetical protein